MKPKNKYTIAEVTSDLERNKIRISGNTITTYEHVGIGLLGKIDFLVNYHRYYRIRG